MKLTRFALVAVALTVLSACYTSQTALVTDEFSVAPYETMTFRNENNEELVFTRNRVSYVTQTEQGETIHLNLMPVEGDFYVAQLSGNSPGKPSEYLYGYMQIDAAKGVALVWRTLGKSEEARPGLRECDNQICIDDINAYIAYGKEAVVGRMKPDMTLPLTLQ